MAVEFFEGTWEAAITFGGLELLDEVGGAGMEYADADGRQGVTEGGGEMCFPGA